MRESVFIVIPFGVADSEPFQHIQQLQTNSTISTPGSCGRSVSVLRLHMIISLLFLE